MGGTYNWGLLIIISFIFSLFAFMLERRFCTILTASPRKENIRKREVIMCDGYNSSLNE